MIQQSGHLILMQLCGFNMLNACRTQYCYGKSVCQHVQWQYCV